MYRKERSKFRKGSEQTIGIILLFMDKIKIFEMEKEKLNGKKIHS